MGKSIIPPRTMRSVWQMLRHQKELGLRVGPRLPSSIPRGPPPGTASPRTPEYPTGLFRKPRNWQFQTKPMFRKVNGPLVDVFHEAEEVLIVIDLSGFQPGEVSLHLTPDKYVILARRGSEEYREEILLPPEADLEKCVETLRNGILEITLPRRRGAELSEGES